MPLLDGVVVTGGTDIDPAAYGGDQWNAHILPADQERDDSELSLVRHLLVERETPLPLHLQGYASAECRCGRDAV